MPGKVTHNASWSEVVFPRHVLLRVHTPDTPTGACTLLLWLWKPLFAHTFLAQQPMDTSPAQRSGLWLEPSLPHLHPQVEADPRPALAAALTSLNSTAGSPGSPVAACQAWLGRGRCSQASSWSELSKKSTPHWWSSKEMYVWPLSSQHRTHAGLDSHAVVTQSLAISTVPCRPKCR